MLLARYGFAVRSLSGTFGQPLPIILMIVGALNCEELLIREESRSMLASCGPLEQDFHFLQPCLLILFVEIMGFCELVREEIELTFDYATKCASTDIELFCHLTH